MATWPHISAKNKTDILPNQEGFHAASEGGAGFTARGSQSMVGRACRTVLAKTPCVESGTHPGIRHLCPTAKAGRSVSSSCATPHRCIPALLPLLLTGGNTAV